MNSNSRNKFNGKKVRFGSDGHRKSAPEPDLCILRADGANLSQWLENMHRHMQKEYGLLGQFIETKSLIDRQIPSLNDLRATYTALSADQCKELLAGCAKDHLKQLRDDMSDYISMFGLIFSCLSEEGAEMVKEHDTWTACNNEKNPLKLINIVKNVHSLRMNNINTAEAQYLASQRYQNIRMLPNVSLSEYRTAFTQAVDNMKELNHPQIPTDAMQALHFIVRLDPDRYKEFTANSLNAHRSGGNFPDTIQKASDAAKSYIPLVRVSNQRITNPMAFSSKFTGTCNCCGKQGHKEKDCWHRKPSADAATNSDGLKRTEATSEPHQKHFESNSTESKPASNKPKKKNKKGKDRTAFSTSVKTDSHQCDIFGFPADLEIDASPSVMSVMSADNNHHAADNTTARTVSLDCLANHSFGFCTDIMTDLEKVNFTIQGVNGSGKGSMIGYLPCFGPIAYTPDSGKNGLALWEAESRYVVDRVQLQHYTVHISDDFDLRFNYDNVTKAYSCEFTDDVMLKLKDIEQRRSISHSTYTTTVSDNESRYSKHEVMNAKMARRLKKTLYYPSDASLIRTINTGTVLNSPVTGKDVLLATSIYGRSPEEIAGKSKDHGPSADTNVYVPIDDRREQTVYADIFYWHSMAFIIFVVKPIHMLMTKHITAKDIASLQGPVQHMINLIVAQGFTVSKIWTDPERGLAALKGKVSVPIETVGARQHVAEAEVEIRILKERLRSTESGLAFNVCQKLVSYMVYGATMAINATPRTDREVSPREKFLGVKLDFKNDLRVPFGEYVQAEVMPSVSEKNTAAKRSVAAIALIPILNGRGTYLFYNIATKSEFTASHWTELPMPDLVIERLNQLYDTDNPNKAGRVKRKKGVNNDNPLVNEVVRATNVQELVCSPDEQNLVRLPTLRELPIEPVVPDLVAVYTDTNGTVEYNGNLNEDENIQDVTLEDDPEDANAEDNHFEMEDPADNLEQLGHITIDGEKRSLRISKRQIDQRVLNAYKLTVSIALKRFERLSKPAILAELRQMVDKEVWEYVDKASLTVQQLRAVIRSSMFLKEKYDAAGAFQKIKARLVAGGDKQDKDLYECLSSPTVSNDSIFMILAIAAIQKRHIATIDITGAYLECYLADGDVVIMELDPLLSKLLEEIDPSVKPFRDSKGKTYVKLKKALYGCVQSSRLWYEKLKSVLLLAGYVVNDHDPCVFNKVIDGIQITLAFHVDDLLVTCVKSEYIDRLIQHLKANFTEISVNRGQNHSYLGMNITVDDKYINVDMIKYIEKILENAKGPIRHAFTPASENLFKISVDSKVLNEEDKSYFHSMVAKLLYLAKRTRPEILTAISWLSSRVQSPTEEDLKKLNQVLGYLSKFIHRTLRYLRGGKFVFECFIDASFGVHSDRTSRTGIIAMLAGAFIGGWSSKQKLVSKSSTEAEVIGLSDGLSIVLWMSLWLQAQGHDLRPVIVYQDNQSTLSLMKTGKKPNQKTKHLEIRYFFAKDRVEAGDISLVYKPTEDMLADIMTKPVCGSQFQSLVERILGYSNA